MARRRLDSELVRRKLVESRQVAQRLIAERSVTVNGSIATKAAHLVAPGDALEILEAPKYVGRGGEKLEGALDEFGLDVAGLNCVDVGSSTGGFSDCLLQRGASQIVAIDVGRAQLHERLRSDPRVDVHESTDVRSVDAGAIGGPFDLAVVDVSFIGLDQVLDSVLALVAEGAPVVALVKPQFEAGRQEADRGRGVISDPAIWRRVLVDVIGQVEHRGAAVEAVTSSPITGGAGNVEFFLLLRVGGHGDRPDDAVISSVIDRAERLATRR